jgi:hypothetical protein
VADTYEHGNELSVSIKSGGILDKLGGYHLLKEESGSYLLA